MPKQRNSKSNGIATAIIFVKSAFATIANLLIAVTIKALTGAKKIAVLNSLGM